MFHLQILHPRGYHNARDENGAIVAAELRGRLDVRLSRRVACLRAVNQSTSSPDVIPTR